MTGTFVRTEVRYRYYDLVVLLNIDSYGSRLGSHCHAGSGCTTMCFSSHETTKPALLSFSDHVGEYQVNPRPRRHHPRGYLLATRQDVARRQAARTPAQKARRCQPLLPHLQGGPPCCTSRNIATPATGPCGKGTSSCASRCTKKARSPSCGACNT